MMVEQVVNFAVDALCIVVVLAGFVVLALLAVGTWLAGSVVGSCAVMVMLAILAFVAWSGWHLRQRERAGWL